MMNFVSIIIMSHDELCIYYFKELEFYIVYTYFKNYILK